MNFASLGISPSICTTVAARGYSEPTPIQLQAIPAVLSRRDLIGLAQTGTGKTAAFALPLLSMFEKGGSKQPQILVVAPTRELAQQIREAFDAYGKDGGFRTICIYGGVRIEGQLKTLRRGVDIVVGTPGRLLDHINRKSLDVRQIKHLVLDEADHMFDMGFLPDIRRLLAALPATRQTLLFSATMPDEILGLAEEVLKDPLSIKASTGSMASTVSHALFPVSVERKSELLEKILEGGDVTSTIIFARTKHRSKRLADVLSRKGYKVACLQGNLSQSRRQEAIKGFRSGQFDILVATDIAARGIDVRQVTHVINFDIPLTVEGYTHRIGRTGRAAREGEAFTLISREDEGKVRAIERRLGATIERRKVDGFDYGSDGFRENSQPERRQRGAKDFNRKEKRTQRFGGFTGRGDRSRRSVEKSDRFERRDNARKSERSNSEQRSPERREHGTNAPYSPKRKSFGNFKERGARNQRFPQKSNRFERRDEARTSERSNPEQRSQERREYGPSAHRGPKRKSFGSYKERGTSNRNFSQNNERSDRQDNAQRPRRSGPEQRSPQRDQRAASTSPGETRKPWHKRNGSEKPNKRFPKKRFGKFGSRRPSENKP